MGFERFQLGRHEHNPVLVAHAPKLKYGLPRPPAFMKILDFTPGMYDNDKLPDCTAAAITNHARAFSVALSATDIPVDAAKVPEFYARTIGVTDLSQLAASQGAQMLDAIKTQQLGGLDVGEQTSLVADYATCPNDRLSLASAMAQFGALYIGGSLTIQDQATGVWHTDITARRGSWGRHAFISAGYTGLQDNDLVHCGTWGTWQGATWQWLEAALDEAYVLLWRQLIPSTMVLAEWQSLVTNAKNLG